MHGLTSETAWHMVHRIREAMTRDPLVGLLEGTIEADETYVGGSPKNETGEVRSQVMRRVTGDTSAPLHSHVNVGNSTLYTDELAAYRHVGPAFATHDTVRHSKKEYARGSVTTITVVFVSKRPTKAEMDERVKVDLPPDEFVEAILETGPHPDASKDDSESKD